MVLASCYPDIMRQEVGMCDCVERTPQFIIYRQAPELSNNPMILSIFIALYLIEYPIGLLFC